MLPCPTCGANIEAHNDELGIAACGQCGGLFEWPLLPLAPAPIAGTARVRVERREGTVSAIHWHSLASAAVLAAAMTVAFLASVFYLALGQLLWTPLMLTLFVLAVGLWQPLRRAVGIHIHLGPVVSSRSGIGRRRRFSAASLRHLFVRRRGPSTNASYDLLAVQADGTVVTFAEGFPSATDARSAEHELEAALGIADAPVPGELDRDVPNVVDTTAPLRATRLVCPACTASVTARDVQLRKGQAVCVGCGKGILLGGPAATGPRALVLLPPTRALVDRSPDAFALEAGLGTGEPGTVRRMALTFAGVAAYLGFLWVRRDSVEPLLLWCALALVWLRTGWMLAMGRWNRARIRVEQGVLHVHVGPLPPRTRRSIPLSDISQVFVRAQPKSFLWFRTEPGGEHYQLCAVGRLSMAEFQVLPLVDRMTDLREARYLEEQLEQHLGIDDAPVSGEVEGKMLRHESSAPSLSGSGNLSLPDASAGGELSVPRATGALSEPD